MRKKLLDKKNVIIFFSLALLMVLAIFVRIHNHHDWLYFKMDQARDAFLISNAVENGPQYLPLLGPRAGATKVSSGYLRLGPMFYYFQYISAKISNSTKPDVFSYPDLFFSILSIPLLYFLLRFYFSKTNSLLVTTMYAFSFIAIQYSRFAWNPNSLLFFSLLSFFSLLKFLSETEKRKKIIWTVLWALGVSIGSQLHFIGLFCLTGISLAMITIHNRIWRKETLQKIKSRAAWKNFSLYFFTFFAVILLVYSPVIISDIFKKGQNTKNFIEAFSTKPKKKPLSYKIERSLNKQAKFYCLLTTSRCYQGKANYASKSVLSAMLLMLFGVALTIFQLIKKRKDHENKSQQDFLWLLLLWFLSLFVLAIPLYSSLRARFFIFVFPVPFIFLGLIFEYLENTISKKMVYLSFLISAGIIALNVQGTRAWFSEQSDSQIKSLPINRTLILKNQDGVTLGQLEKAADYMHGKMKPGNALYYYIKPEHVLPIKYTLYEKKDASLKYDTIKNIHDSNGQYFAIIPSKKSEDYLRNKFKGNSLKIISSYQAGQIKIWEIEFEGEKEAGDFKFNRETGESDRIFWKDVFGIQDKKEGVIRIQGTE